MDSETGELDAILIEAERLTQTVRAHAERRERLRGLEALDAMAQEIRDAIAGPQGCA